MQDIQSAQDEITEEIEEQKKMIQDKQRSAMGGGGDITQLQAILLALHGGSTYVGLSRSALEAVSQCCLVMTALR